MWHILELTDRPAVEVLEIGSCCRRPYVDRNVGSVRFVYLDSAEGLYSANSRFREANVYDDLPSYSIGALVGPDISGWLTRALA